MPPAFWGAPRGGRVHARLRDRATMERHSHSQRMETRAHARSSSKFAATLDHVEPPQAYAQQGQQFRGAICRRPVPRGMLSPIHAIG